MRMARLRHNLAMPSHKHLMPPSTRAFATVWARVTRADIGSWGPDDFARKRRAVTPSRRPFTWVTGAVPAGVTIRTTCVPMRDGSTIPARVLRSADTTGDAPVILYLHGGGWSMSNPANYDPLAGHLADAVGAVVVAPDYRKAPQAKAPQAALDAYDTLEWIARRPQLLSVEGPIALVGDSAGGNLATVISILSRDLDGPAIAGQALLYPATDLTRSHPSSRWRDEAVLPGDAIDAYLDAYLTGSAVAPDDPIVSPLWAPSHQDLPPCLIQTAECDPLVDEGEHYGRVLQAAGVPTRVTRYAGMPHGFMSFPGITPVGRQARAELVTCLRAWLPDASNQESARSRSARVDS